MQPMKGSDARYSITPVGSVWSWFTRSWKPWHDKNGCARVDLTQHHKTRHFQVGRLVAPLGCTATWTTEPVGSYTLDFTDIRPLLHPCKEASPP
ncbi:MAG: hypothetical protein RBG13Loki_4258 [Promethearchaeota archaeon CR_4]|nr:MAG: hypothetical protein RBG13Loki_4258 [Candidatus Lokiarchaeota archaeon CR_4]